MSRATENSDVKQRAKACTALTHIESSDDARGVSRHELQIRGRLAVQELVLRREASA